MPFISVAFFVLFYLSCFLFAFLFSFSLVSNWIRFGVIQNSEYSKTYCVIWACLWHKYILHFLFLFFVVPTRKLFYTKHKLKCVKIAQTFLRSKYGKKHISVCVCSFCTLHVTNYIRSHKYIGSETGNLWTHTIRFGFIFIFFIAFRFVHLLTTQNTNTSISVKNKN